MQKIILRLGLLTISLLFTIAGITLIDKTNLVQIILCVLGAVISLLLAYDLIQEIRVVRNQKVKSNPIIIRIIIALLLVLTTISCFIKVIDNTIFQIKNENTKATITKVIMDIDTAYNRDNRISKKRITTCNTEITFYANNKEYKRYLDTNQCIFQKNDKVNIYYNKNNPNQIRSIPVILFHLAVFIMSLTSTIIYFITIRRIRKIEE